MADGLNALRAELRESQLKQSYYLMSAAGASIAFYVSRSEPVEHNLYGFLLILPLLMWGVSFFYGMRFVSREEEVLITNHTYLEAIQDNPHVRPIARSWLDDEVAKIGKARRWSRRLQLFTLMLGAAVFAFNEVWLPGFT